MTTNAERGILCQTIDAKLDAPNPERAAQWLKLAGKVPCGETMSVQFGVSIEEMAELFDAATLLSPGNMYGPALNEASRVLKEIGEALKSGECHVYFHDRHEALDGMSDVCMTLDGVAYLGGFDKIGYDRRMYDSLFDKFNEDGSVVLKPGGKIGKRAGWAAPDTGPFVGEMPSSPAEVQGFQFEAEQANAWVTAINRAGTSDKNLHHYFALAIEAGKALGRHELAQEIEDATPKGEEKA